jgi:hypothetical protein
MHNLEEQKIEQSEAIHNNTRQVHDNDSLVHLTNMIPVSFGESKNF